MTSSSTFTSIDNPSRHESYLLGMVIGKGSSSTIYLATCTRGRLKGRKVAVKAFVRTDLNLVDEASPITTIQSLHHPALVSIHSSFEDSSIYYVVLELCEGGNLCELIYSASQRGSEDTKSTLLTEAQSRLIIRKVVEGLAHLHAHDVVHGDVRPHNVLFTGDGRIKLGGHGQLKAKTNSYGTLEGPHNNFFQKSSYIAPEIATNGPSSFVSDLWSLGCLIVTILTGRCPFETENSMDVQRMKLNDSYKFHEDTKLPQHAQDLITSLLKIDPQRRMPLRDVLSHAFLDPSLPTESLVTALNWFRGKNTDSERYQVVKYRSKGHAGLAPPASRYHKDEILKKRVFAGLSCRMPSVGIPISTAAVSPIRQDRTKPPPRPRLCSTSSGLASSGIHNTWRRLSSRQQVKVSSSPDRTGLLAVAEVTQQKPELVETARKALGEVGNLGRPFSKISVGSGEVCLETMPGEDCGKREKYIQPSGLLSPPETKLGQPLLDEGGPCDASSTSSSLSTSILERRTWKQGWQSRPKDNLPVLSLSPYVHPIPIPRTSPPKALQVAPLLPQTHKTVHGQLIILPSQDLLVDLREGDRRAGGKGDRIICVSPEGQEIKVYEAPHLSTPCVLSEPRETWILDGLPERYWEKYIFASKYLESVKKRTPWVVWYTPQAKFTVMSNGPKGDLHVSFPCPSHGLKEKHHVSGKASESYIKMKIKFSRQQDTLELSRYASSSKQRERGEWISKSETITEERLKLGAVISSLTAEERQGLVCLIEGLKLAEAAEDIYMVARSQIGEKGSSTSDNFPDRLLQADTSASASALTPHEPEASPISDSKQTPNLAQSELFLRQTWKRSLSAGMNAGSAKIGYGCLGQAPET